MALTLLQNFGLLLIANMFNLVLYGISLILVLQYFRSHSARDHVGTKLTVGLLLVFATVEATVLAYHTYIDFVDRFGQPELLDDITIPAMITCFVAYSAAFTAQLFFATRIYKLAPKPTRLLYAAPVVIFATIQIVFAIIETVRVSQLRRFSLLESIATLTSVQTASSALCDIAITGILCWLLNTSRTGIKRTDTVIDMLMLYAINRGAVTSIAAAMNCILFVVIPNTLYYTLFRLPGSQLYAISVANMLITRSTLRERLGSIVTDGSLALSSIRVRNPTSTTARVMDLVSPTQSLVSWNESRTDTGGGKDDKAVYDSLGF